MNTITVGWSYFEIWKPSLLQKPLLLPCFSNVGFIAKRLLYSKSRAQVFEFQKPRLKGSQDAGQDKVRTRLPILLLLRSNHLTDYWLALPQPGEEEGSGKQGTTHVQPGLQEGLCAEERMTAPANEVQSPNNLGACASVSLRALWKHSDPRKENRHTASGRTEPQIASLS